MMEIPLIPFEIAMVIVNHGKGSHITDVLSEYKLYFHVSLMGHGTADKKILSILGLGETRKDILIIGIPTPMVKPVLDRICEEANLYKPGKGIVLSLPVNQAFVTQHRNRIIDTNGMQGDIDMNMDMDMTTATEIDTMTHDLIVAILNHGYADDVMDTARDAGAKGGTVMRAYGAGAKQMEKFLGITIQPEKDLLLILAKKEASVSIQKAIVDTHGLTRDANALTFSLPVNHVEGLTPLKKPKHQ